MIYYKTVEEVELIRNSCLIVGKALAEVGKLIQPGVTMLALDQRAEEVISDSHAAPGFKNYRGFPNSLCISINDGVVHGIPTSQVLEEGDIVSIDCGAYKDGFFGDSAYTFSVGEISDAKRKLLEVTKESLYKGIEKAVVGQRIGDIGFAVQDYVVKYGYSVVRDLVGHGVGRDLHEAPEVPNYGKRGQGLKLLDGLVIAIEPMINEGKHQVVRSKDNWTIKTQDGSPSAHFEHTVVVRKGKAEILSTFQYIEELVENCETAFC